MKDAVKIGRGFLALFIVGAILLFSDLSNRQNIRHQSDKSVDLAVVHWMDAPVIEKMEAGLMRGLKERGLEPGQNLTIHTYKASGDVSMLNSIMKQVASMKPDLLLVSCTPALQSAINQIQDIPVVFTAVSDPVLAGAGTDAVNHLPNVTGCNTECDFDVMCKLVVENAPQIKTMGSIYCPGEVISMKFKESFTKVAQRYGLRMKFFPANNPAELPDAVLGMCTSDIDAVCQMGDNLMGSGIATLIKGVQKVQLPYFDFNARPQGSPMESLIQLDVDYFENGYEAASLVSKIVLEGISPANLPFRSPSKAILEINPAKAKKLGISFNQATRQQADIIAGEKEAFYPTVKMALVDLLQSPDCKDVETGILQRFNELGHNENRDFILDRYNANGDITTLNSIVNVVAGKQYDLIFSTVLAPLQALAGKIKDVPILFTVVADPVSNGLGRSYEVHQPNVTGIDALSYMEEGVDLVQQYLPDVEHLGLLYCPAESAAEYILSQFKDICKKQNIRVSAIPVTAVGEVSDATMMLCSKGVDAICQMPDNVTIPGFSSMIKISRKQQVPLFCFITSQVEMGAVAAVAGDFIEQGREIADVAIEVIHGKSPESIPFSRIQQIKTVVNPAAAQAYGLRTPESVRKQADYIVATE